MSLYRLVRGARKGLAVAGIAGVMALGVVPAAVATDEAPDPRYADEPTLRSVCIGDVPYLSGSVDFGEPEAGKQGTWQWLDADGNVRLEGTFTLDSEGKTTFSSIWPGASVDPPDWPGWTLVDGVWVEDPNDEGAWTRYPEGVVTTITATVNPTVSASLTYPPATAVCANPPNDGGGGNGGGDNGGETPVCDENPGDGVNDDLPVCQELPATGANVGTAALVGAGLLAVGAGAVALSRRRGGQSAEV